jgi:hypothetical protein
MTSGAAQRVLRHRLAMMAVTLDGAAQPPRARLVWSLVEHGGQPLNPDAAAHATAVDDIDPQTLAAIADLYGVPRGYLTDIGGDPVSKRSIDDDFFRIRTTTPRSPTARTYETVARAPIPQPAPDEVHAISAKAREIADARTRAAVPEAVITTLIGVVIAGGLALIGTPVTWLCSGAALLVFTARTVYLTRRIYREAGLTGLPDAAFENAVQSKLRDVIARHFHTLRTTSRLPLEQLVAILDSTTPIGTVQLTALTGGNDLQQQQLVSSAVTAAMQTHHRTAGAAA